VAAVSNRQAYESKKPGRETCPAFSCQSVTQPILPARLHAMPSRGRHQSSSKECHQIMRKIEALEGVVGVIIGRSYGGKSLGQGCSTGAIKIQRKVPGGLKAVTQSAKGLQELFIRTEEGMEERITAEILKL
jgi:hypothetical protein